MPIHHSPVLQTVRNGAVPTLTLIPLVTVLVMLRAVTLVDCFRPQLFPVFANARVEIEISIFGVGADAEVLGAGCAVHGEFPDFGGVIVANLELFSVVAGA